MPASEVLAAAVAHAREFAHGPPRALAAAKAAVHAADLDAGAAGLARERELFVGLFGTPDQREGMRAFLEKRDPTFGGVRPMEVAPGDRRPTSRHLVGFFPELDRMQREWRVFTPRPGFYDEVGAKYREAIASEDQLVVVAEEDDEVVGMAYGEVQPPSRFSDERALELSGVIVRSDYPGPRGGPGVGVRGREVRHRARDRRGSSSRPSRRTGARWTSGRSLGFTPRVVQMTSSSAALAGRLRDA